MIVHTTHEQLSNWVEIMTAISLCYGGFSVINSWRTRGWKIARKLKEEQMHKTILDLIDSKQTQFRRIDELRRDVDNCVKRDAHDQLQKEISIRFETVTSNLSQQIRDGFASVNARIDRLTDRDHK